MARLPIPGQDDGTWGAILNDFLAQSHDTDGTLKTNTVNTGQIGDNAVTEPKLAVSNAPASGQVLSFNGTDLAWETFTGGSDPAMGGDLSGTASNAQIAAGAVGSTELASTDLKAIAALTPVNDDLLQRKAGTWTNRTPAQLKTDLTLTKTDVGLANVDNTSDANKPVSTATQTALSAKADDSAVVHNTTTYASDPAAPLVKVNKTYATNSSSRNISEYYDSTNALVAWQNEWGAWRFRIPAGENFDAGIRIIAASNQTGKLFQVQDTTRTQNWFYVDSDGSISTMANLNVDGTSTLTGDVHIVGNLTVDGTSPGGGSGPHAWTPSDNGLLGATTDPALIGGSSGPTGGLVYLVKQVTTASLTVSNVVLHCGTAGSGLTASQNFVGVYDASGTLIGQSADVSTTFASTGPKVVPVSVTAGQSLTIPSNTYYYVAFLFNGTTIPLLGRTSTFTTMANANLTASSGAGGYRFASSGGGQTTLPASITFASINPVLAYWAGVS